MNNYESPEFGKKAFHCPHCSVYAHMGWFIPTGVGFSDLRTAQCSHCNSRSFWLVTDKDYSGQAISGRMLYPDNGNTPIPEKDMPDDVRTDYLEAATIFSRSPRGAAALLRLALQKLCKHLGEEGKNINNDIRNLSSNGILPPQVIKVADTVRITGNNAVHPGEMSDEDFDYVASKMFGLLNFIVKKSITEPKELEELYLKTPEAPRKSAEEKDEKSRTQF